MEYRARILGLVVILYLNASFAANSYSVTEEVKFEVLKSGRFRAHVPDRPEITKFNLFIKINDGATITGQVKAATNGFRIIDFNDSVKVGDTIHYSANVESERLRYSNNNLIWKVEDSDLREAYTVLDSCNGSLSTVDGKQGCRGKFIMLDEFGESSVNISKWTVETRIPTYEGVNLEFNSYENTDSTIFTKNGVLYLKPIARTNENDVRGILDLTNGCTSSDHKQCYYQHHAAFLLPPVKSARIKSKIAFKYGKIEIKAKLPAGDWIVPILQLESKDNNYADFSPKILIAYSRGNANLVAAQGFDIGSRILYAGPVIFPNSPEDNQKLIKRANSNNKPYNSDFHTYTLEWLPDKLSFSIDGKVYGAIDSWQDVSAFNKELRLSLGVAIGGEDDFSDDFYSGTNSKPWIKNTRNYVKSFFDARNIWLKTWSGDDTALRIAHVKVWAV